MERSICTVCTISDILLVCKLCKSGLWIMHYIWEVILTLVFFDNSWPERFFSTVSYLLGYCGWSVNYVSWVSKFTIFVWHVQKLRKVVYLRTFSIVVYWKFNSNVSAFQRCMSWIFDFRYVQKLKHWFIFGTFYYCYL